MSSLSVITVFTVLKLDSLTVGENELVSAVNFVIRSNHCILIKKCLDVFNVLVESIHKCPELIDSLLEFVDSLLKFFCTACQHHCCSCEHQK